MRSRRRVVALIAPLAAAAVLACAAPACSSHTASNVSSPFVEPYPTSTSHPAYEHRSPSRRALLARIRTDAAAMRAANGNTAGPNFGSARFDKIEAEWQLGDMTAAIRDLPVATYDDAALARDPRAGFQAYLYSPLDGDRSDLPPELIAAQKEATANQWARALAHLRRVNDDNRPFGNAITAALLEGDAYAACGHWADARTTWRRAFLTPATQTVDIFTFMPQWSSSLRRSARFRVRADTPSSRIECRGFPRPQAAVLLRS